MAGSTPPWGKQTATACLVLADGTVIYGRGLGATGEAVAEVVFNTALTGYQEPYRCCFCLATMVPVFDSAMAEP